jgi:hypothetical protein
MATSPIFVGTPRLRNLVLTNANGGDTAYINPTTIATVLTMGGTGGRIDSIFLQPVGTNASCVVRFFVDAVGTGGTNNILVNEQFLTVSTSSSVAALTPAVWRASLVLPASAVLRSTVSNTSVTNGVAITVEYGEF